MGDAQPGLGQVLAPAPAPKVVPAHSKSASLPTAAALNKKIYELQQQLEKGQYLPPETGIDAFGIEKKKGELAKPLGHLGMLENARDKYDEIAKAKEELIKKSESSDTPIGKIIATEKDIMYREKKARAKQIALFARYFFNEIAWSRDPLRREFARKLDQWGFHDDIIRRIRKSTKLAQGMTELIFKGISTGEDLRTKFACMKALKTSKVRGTDAVIPDAAAIGMIDREITLMWVMLMQDAFLLHNVSKITFNYADADGNIKENTVQIFEMGDGPGKKDPYDFIKTLDGYDIQTLGVWDPSSRDYV